MKIFIDADLEKATTAIACHGTANSGQFCCRVNRVYVERPIYEAFFEKLTAKVSALSLAPTGENGDWAKGLTPCEGLEAGLIWLKNIQRSLHYTFFGDVKQSGMGRKKGCWGVEKYLEYKTIYLSYEVPE